MIAIGMLAENNFGDTRSGGLAGPMGLFIITVLGVVTVFLIRNMSARIKRLPDRFPDPAESQGAAGSQAAGSQGSGSQGAGDVSDRGGARESDSIRMPD
jgi:hypothetical protein